MDESMIQSAQAVLQGFMDEMKEWEIKWYKVNIEADYQQLIILQKGQIKELINIQDKCLSKKSRSLEQSRRSILDVQSPPEYDQTIVKYEVL